ncbi:MAG: thiolase family protein [Hyphomicrobiales bacterium]|nr:thiolase family protein [Hyphomicrobiales bacterium]
MHHLRDKYAIVGAGKSRLGRVPGVSALGLLEEAISNALTEAGLTNAEVDGLICRGPDDVYSHHQLMAERLGINTRFGTTLDNGGASQILAVALAVMAIDAGMATTVVCGYGRNSWSRSAGPKDSAAKSQPNLVPTEQRPKEHGPEFGYFGAVAPHAFGARRHMFEYGTTRDDFAAIAIAFREHALRNPDAVMKKPLTYTDYIDARLIVDPFGLYDCSLVSDGAGAVVVTSAERARSLRTKPVLIKGFGSFNNSRGWFLEDHMVSTAAAESGKQAFRMAGIGPNDVDVAQLYDCFTYMVLTQLEDYGFCQKGEGGAFARSGALSLQGGLPTNTSGGQLSEAHVEGMLQIVEGVRQLQGVYSPEQQVPNAEIALISGHGGNTVCHSTLILSRS